MSYEVKFGYFADYSLVFAAFQPDGTGRGVQQQPLPEMRNTGYYSATPAEALVVGDIVLVYQLKDVIYEDELVTCLAYPAVVHEGIRVHYEGDLVESRDSETNQIVTCVDDPVGSGEYEDVTDVSDNIDTLIEGQTSVFNVYDEREGAAGGTGDGVESLITHDC